MTVRDYAEKILLSETLAEKLAPPPPGLSLDPPHKGSYRSPDMPGRPELLRPRSARETRTKIPSVEQLDNEEHRSVLLHFFCNHELLAVELMALALLKFPDAPDAFRRGLLHTLQEEQEHTRLYLDRMAATGTEFGDHSLSSMIWDHIATMTSPLEYVSRLSLTFEQSNLDYANYYSKAFARVGDQTTSDLLAQIYKDEIAHVGYGLKWLRRFKQEKESDWDAWHRSLAHPLSPVRAKAPERSVPFNTQGREKAGLDADFIENLKIYQRSRGRTPFVHYFNPNGEAHAAAELQKKRYQPNKSAAHLEQDLEALIFANGHPDDLALMRVLPSPQHLATLREAGLPLPEISSLSDISLVAERKLGGFLPWAWTPDASQLFAPLRNNPTPNSIHSWRPSLAPEQLSKSLTTTAAEELGLANNQCTVFDSATKAHAYIEEQRQRGPLLLKPSLGCAGRGHLAVTDEITEQALSSWIGQTLESQGSFVVEPLLDRRFDFSALYDISPEGETRFIAFTQLLTDSRGKYLGTRVAPKIGNLFPAELTILFHQDCIDVAGESVSGPHFYKKVLSRSLSRFLPHYSGPVAVDGFFYRTMTGETQVRPIVEINARYSMGRIAHNLRRKLAPNAVGELRIHRVKTLDGVLPAGLALNDPETAQSFLAVWNASENSSSS